MRLRKRSLAQVLAGADIPGMREDMDKVLVERPRYGGHGVRKGRPSRDPDLLRGFLGHRRAVWERGQPKDLNENLAPLKRYLQRQVDRPWNKVNSEMRARINPANEVQAHVLTHLDQFIAVKARKVAASAAAPCGLTGMRGWSQRFHALAPGELYVDPDDGIIKRARKRKV